VASIDGLRVTADRNTDLSLHGGARRELQEQCALRLSGRRLRSRLGLVERVDGCGGLGDHLTGVDRVGFDPVRLVEAAPAGTLVGLAKRGMKGTNGIAVNVPEDIDAVVAALAAEDAA